MKDFRDLQVWEKSHQLALDVYRTTENFPQSELYGLRAQIRRAAVSIPTNIAEGCGRSSDTDFKRFLQMAFGSASEVEYQLLLAKDLQYLSADQCNSMTTQVNEIKRMLSSFMKKLKADR